MTTILKKLCVIVKLISRFGRKFLLSIPRFESAIFSVDLTWCRIPYSNTIQKSLTRFLTTKQVVARGWLKIIKVSLFELRSIIILVKKKNGQSCCYCKRQFLTLVI